MNTTKRGFYNIFFGVFSQILIMAFALVTPRLVIENYGSEVNGLLHSVAQIFAYFSLFEAGVGSATLQALYAPVANHDINKISGILSATGHFYSRTGIIYALGVTAVSFLYPVAVHTSLSYFFVVGIIFLGGIGGCINFIYQGKYTILMQAEGYSYVITSINLICNTAQNVVKIILLLRGYNVLTIQFLSLLISLLRAIIYHRFIKKHYRDVDLKATPDFASISQKNAVFVHQISYLIFSSTDVLLLTFLTQDLKIVSVYTLYNAIVSAFFTLIQHFSNGFDYRLGQLFAVDKERYYRIYHVFEIYHLILAFSVMSALYCILLPFMKLYTQGITDINYIHQWYPLLFIAVPIVTHGRTSASSTIAFAGHFEQTKKYTIIEASINLIFTFIGILLLGLPGALIGTILASVYRTSNIIWYVYKNLIPGSPWMTIKRWLYCLSIFGLVVILVYLFPISVANYFQVFFYAVGYGLLCLLVFSGGLYFLNPYERYEMAVIAKNIIKELIFKLRG